MKTNRFDIFLIFPNIPRYFQHIDGNWRGGWVIDVSD